MTGTTYNTLRYFVLGTQPSLDDGSLLCSICDCLRDCPQVQNRKARNEERDVCQRKEQETITTELLESRGTIASRNAKHLGTMWMMRKERGGLRSKVKGCGCEKLFGKDSFV